MAKIAHTVWKRSRSLIAQVNQQLSDPVGFCPSKSTYDIETHCSEEEVTFKRFSDPACSLPSYMPEKDVSLMSGKCDLSIFGQVDGSESYVIVTMLN